MMYTSMKGHSGGYELHAAAARQRGWGASHDKKVNAQQDESQENTNGDHGGP